MFQKLLVRENQAVTYREFYFSSAEDGTLLLVEQAGLLKRRGRCKRITMTSRTVLSNIASNVLGSTGQVGHVLYIFSTV